MTVADLCIALGKILPKRTVQNLHWEGLINTRRIHNRDYHIKVREVHARLKSNIEKVKRESAKTISDLQAGIDLIESLK